MDYERLADIQGRRVDGDETATDELIRLGGETDNELWSLVNRILRSDDPTEHLSHRDRFRGYFEDFRPEARAYYLDGMARGDIDGMFRLSCDGWPERFSGLARLGDIHGLAFEKRDELTYESGRLDADIAQLVEHPHCQRLVSLEFRASGVSLESARRLADANLSNLRRLRFDWEGLQPEGMMAIVSNPSLEHLRELEFDFCASSSSDQWTADSLTNLDDCAFSGTLEKLTLSASSIPADTLRGFLDNATLIKSLESLSFGDGEGEGSNGFGNEGLKALAHCPHTTNLQRLEIGGCNTRGDEGLAAILDSETFPELTELNLGVRYGLADYDFSDDIVARAEKRYHTVRYRR